eukprot:CAMPEP_0174373164 /NCGR_PEP_ID=MMETSP0811_2-20130205/106050_1 /TAXON_ID=73025 ORGANISM="Eutreptiella gymnastica-like, Strain CCMP1594" /NCGR_SAMPLE_ID=MMETSP0811_2 /ASSEMBLY_ACC=CAM_ASM_000667 /LENGTH=434 /DNA_ID=CAMNT_0015521203 /DNA_START=69 /DNA_END=1370 /DNA_ORIENTATION=+
MDQACGHVFKDVLFDRCFASLTSLSVAVESKELSLLQDKQKFASAAAEAEVINQQQAQCQYLDVGGLRFHTTLEVLQREAPHMLSVLFSTDFPTEADNDGYSFIDRDPQWFPTVLGYLREGSLFQPSDLQQRKSLLREAQFYSVEVLINALRGRPFLVILGSLGEEIATYAVHTGEWMCHPVTANWCPAAYCTSEGYIYVAAGHEGGGLEFDGYYITDVERYDLANGIWSHIATLPIVLFDRSENCTLCVVGEYLIVAGYDVSLKPVIQSLSLLSGTRRYWSLSDSKQYIVASCILQGQWLCFRRDGTVASTSVAHFAGTISESRWEVHKQSGWAPRRRFFRGGAEAVAWQGKAVVLGHDKGGRKTVHVYDPSSKTWSSLAPVPLMNDWGSMVCVNDDIIVLGQVDRDDEDDLYVAQIHRYCAATATWKTIPAE